MVTLRHEEGHRPPMQRLADRGDLRKALLVHLDIPVVIRLTCASIYNKRFMDTRLVVQWSDRR